LFHHCEYLVFCSLYGIVLTYLEGVSLFLAHPVYVVLNRKRKFLIKYASLDNLICSVCQNFANPETAAVSVVWPAEA